MTDSAYDWLPDRHLGVAATLAHSDELIGQISDLLFPYQTQPEGIIRLREDRHGSVSRTVVAGVAPMPRKIPLLVADALVALRAAIEHTIFTEVEHLDGALDEKAAKVVEMPAFTTSENFEGWMKGRKKNGSPSLQDGSEIVRRIEALQPFHSQPDPELHPLARLVSHTNHAKHRTPAVVAVGLAGMYEDANVPASIDDLPPGPVGPLNVGDVLAETPIGVQIPVTLFPFVGINRPGTDVWPVLLKELDEIAEWVRTEAVPLLITGCASQEPALPVHYDIETPHTDERPAIEAGTFQSTAARHTRRLLAKDGRIELVELVSRLDRTPNRQTVAAWADNLSDDEVNGRLEQLAATGLRNPFLAIQVVYQFREDVIAFTEVPAASPEGTDIQ
ncbi:hypothetical protein [Tsukamurella strandjordii]|uniref:Uncharacterized protein n=1 Tax=Tsukamurella strandjordii TaxID=147577 RepID=A0AA90S953_9ACTN|nr:hypothetical protein [Tsukamurella strandjordii]MDP0399785.1 hypothetical protein [Tsukamurella strandjordii]